MAEPTIVPETGAALPGDFAVLVRVRSEQTNRVMAAIEQMLRPKAFIPPHVHLNDVWVYVLSGEIGVLVGEDVGTARRGDWTLKPRDVQHAMWNPGGQPARIIGVLTPGGAERWFEEIAALDDGDEAGFDETCARHGITFFRHSARIAELRRRYALD
jgi:quercetin dioxygenase-like cupin family protein